MEGVGTCGDIPVCELMPGLVLRRHLPPLGTFSPAELSFSDQWLEISKTSEFERVATGLAFACNCNDLHWVTNLFRPVSGFTLPIPTTSARADHCELAVDHVFSFAERCEYLSVIGDAERDHNKEMGCERSSESKGVDVFTKGTNGEPAVLPNVRVVLHVPITKQTESDALGAFAIDGLSLEPYQIEANASSLYAGLAVRAP